MITGAINAAREAVIRLRVYDAIGTLTEFDAVIDTGYNGLLTLDPGDIARLGLPKAAPGRAILADGTVVSIEYYVADLDWNGVRQRVFISAIEGPPLVGMELLETHRVTMDIVLGGKVTIESLP